MKTVWKYNLELTDHQNIQMPVGAVPLSVGMQGSQAVIWVLVDTERASQSRRIRIVGTGQEAGEFIGEYAGRLDFPDARQHYHVFMY